VSSFFCQQRNSFKWPLVYNEYQCPEFLQPPPLEELQRMDRVWTVPRVVDFSCEKRILRPVNLTDSPELAALSLSGADIRAFASHPLSCIGLSTYCAAQTRCERR
jgi:hypothetical protein